MYLFLSLSDRDPVPLSAQDNSAFNGLNHGNGIVLLRKDTPTPWKYPYKSLLGLFTALCGTTGADRFFFLFGHFVIPATRTLVVASILICLPCPYAHSKRIANAHTIAPSDFSFCIGSCFLRHEIKFLVTFLRISH
jgi:hypothetical protein